LQELPKVDPETGITFTKQQLRRMRKRLERGLNPIETAREKHERMQQRAQELRQEQDEWADMIVTSKREQDNDDDDDDNSEAEDNDDDDDDDAERDDDMERDDGDDDNAEKKTIGEMKFTKKHTADVREEEESRIKQQQLQPKTKQARGHKPVPSDYVCQACKNKHTPAHWIYDCPDKVTVHGTNKKKKKKNNHPHDGDSTANNNSTSTTVATNTTSHTKGIHDPDARKVFLSGLPFDTKQRDIVKLFASHKCGSVVNCRMIKFEDTGRCKGQAYVTLETEEHAQKACSLLNGITIGHETFATDDAADDSKKKSKQKQPQNQHQHKEPLKLKVVKVLNRLATKKRQ
jgi:RNA recognition motif. (a.k.a. RRM, RBD, or RNP domain)